MPIRSELNEHQGGFKKMRGESLTRGSRQPWGWVGGRVAMMFFSPLIRCKGTDCRARRPKILLCDLREWVSGLGATLCPEHSRSALLDARRLSPPLCEPIHQFLHIWRGLLQSRSPGGINRGTCQNLAPIPFLLAGHDFDVCWNNWWVKGFKRQERSPRSCCFLKQ